MQRWGKTAAGATRFRCPICKQSHTVVRPDIRIRADTMHFRERVLGIRSLADLAAHAGISRQALTKRYRPFWDKILLPVVPPASVDVLIIDAIYLEANRRCALLGRTRETVVWWTFADRECYGAWMLFFRSVPPPRIVVCDGQRGMRAAIRDTWRHSRVQRCVFHVHGLAMSRLTRHPKTGAGQKLRYLIHTLMDVRTRRQKRRWIKGYRKWRKTSDVFLRERTHVQLPGKRRSWWYTHKNLRSVRSLIDNALPELFTYVGHPDIPRTTNHVEGGLNSVLSEHIYRHRGFSVRRKEVMVATILKKIQMKKPTRKFT